MSKPPAPSPPAFSLRRYEALIFLTGAVTLSLEVLASRIMTPYFGVSLYIWAGILSITLSFLALGYSLGGRLSDRVRREHLIVLLLWSPMVAAMSLVASAALYPLIFPWLATKNLVLASYLGGAMLLALPLLTLAAMNPWLIALGRSLHPGGDGGAGRVFFLSTVGSVAGVVLTAFALIPYCSNIKALLGLSLGLALLSAALAWGNRSLEPSLRQRLLAAGVLIAALGGALLWGQPAYGRLLAHLNGAGHHYDILADYPSAFGNIKVVRIPSLTPEQPAELLYIQDGLLQNHATVDGQARDHTLAMMHLAEALAPQARESLVLGLGAGLLPQYLHRLGQKVQVVELNPQSLKAAAAYFHFNPLEIPCRLEDARTFVRRHRAAFDLVAVDLFQGDSTPDYLLTVEFFRDLRACLRPGGLALMNLHYDAVDERVNEVILATLAAAFPHVLECRAPRSEGPVGNLYLVASVGPLDPEAPRRWANRRHASLDDDGFRVLLAARRVDPERLRQTRVVRDDRNMVSVLTARTHLRFRSYLNRLPAHLLIN
jgi:spermidine synthase